MNIDDTFSHENATIFVFLKWRISVKAAEASTAPPAAPKPQAARRWRGPPRVETRWGGISAGKKVDSTNKSNPPFRRQIKVDFSLKMSFFKHDESSKIHDLCQHDFMAI